MPDASDDTEEAEDEDLKNETAEDNVLAHVEAVSVVGGNEDTGTASLDKAKICTLVYRASRSGWF